MIDYFLDGNDVSSEQFWALLDWCRLRGASEFTLDMMEFAKPSRACDHARSVLRPFFLGEFAREQLTGSKEDLVRPSPIWSLNQDSRFVLELLLPDGLLTYPAGDWEDGRIVDGWIENPTVYRDKEFILGLISHEDFGYLRLRDDERADFASMGITASEMPKAT